MVVTLLAPDWHRPFVSATEVPLPQADVTAASSPLAFRLALAKAQ
jgi:hypothetical protein